jgi:inhibitor of KinA sporulation pathway (predicted exonuclease)
MKTAIIFDCEFLCLEGSQRRFWGAAHDPDPVIAQIGAVKLGLEGEFPILDTYKSYVRPIDRFGKRYPLGPYFTNLTGITEEDIDTHGVVLEDALSGVDSFSGGARFWSWGKDELNMLAISCYVAGIQPSIPAHRFDNAVKLLIAAGMPIEDLAKTPSNKLADYY